MGDDPNWEEDRIRVIFGDEPFRVVLDDVRDAVQEQVPTGSAGVLGPEGVSNHEVLEWPFGDYEFKDDCPKPGLGLLRPSLLNLAV